MTVDVAFSGFDGRDLTAGVAGADDDPTVLLINGRNHDSQRWRHAAAGLVAAGRRVVALDLRAVDSAQEPDFDADVRDLRAVLSQLHRRPVIVAAGDDALMACAAVEHEAATLAAALVLVDVPARCEQDIANRMRRAGPTLSVPIMLVRGYDKDVDRAPPPIGLPDTEEVDLPGATELSVEERAEAFSALLVDFLERRQPRITPEFRSGSDARTLRDALGCFATGVTIVTATGEDGPIGLTANSFTSVSLDPPLLLVCVANETRSGACLRAADRFAVNILQIGQQAASGAFASRNGERFNAVDWTLGETGVPILASSLGSFECDRYAVHEGGDHFILVGRVIRATFEPRRDPLLFFRGKYRRLHFA